MKVILRRLLSVLPKLLKRLGKIFVCCILSATLVFCYSFRKPAKAAAAPVIVASAAIAAALAALGVGISTNLQKGTYTQLISQISEDANVAKPLSAIQQTVVAGQVVYNVTKDFLSAVGNSFMAAYQNFKAGTYLQKIGGAAVVHGTGKWAGLEALAKDKFGVDVGNNKSNPYIDITEYSVLNPVLWQKNGNSFKATFTAGGTNFTVTPSGDNWVQVNGNSVNIQCYNNFITGGLAFYLVACNVNQKNAYGDTQFKSLYYYLVNFDFIKNQSSNGCQAYWVAKAITNGKYEGKADEVIATDDKFFADGKSILNNPVDVVVDAAASAVGQTGVGGFITVPLHMPKDFDTSTEATWDTTQAKVLDKDIATDADKELDDKANKEKDTTKKPYSLPDLSLPEIIFKEKFPFCIPWDFYNAFHGMVTASTPPKWNYPFEVKSLGIKQNITIDFAQFEPIAAIIRWGLSIGFVILLIWGTRKLIGAGD